MLYPLLAPALVTPIHPQVREAWKALASGLQQQPDPILVGYLSAVDLGLEDQAFRIHEQVALAPADLLAAVVASMFTADPARLGRLRIDDTRARLRFSPQPYPQALAQRHVEPLEGPVDAPLPEPMVDGFPRREVTRQEPPGTATLEQVEDSVQDLAWAMY